MLARQQEVFAGFLTHTDAQIGRLLSSLERLGVLDDTLVMVFSDNGASAEGGTQGSFNEHRFTAHLRESVEENLAHYDDWGGFTTYCHYSWGWAWAGNTPHKLWKRYTWLGGTRTPLIVRWPRPCLGSGRGEAAVRSRHRPHADDHGRGGAGTPGGGRRRRPAATRRGEPPPRPRGPRMPGGPSHPVLRDDGFAVHLPRRLEGDDRPHRHGRPRRGGTRGREPGLRRGPLGALRPRLGLLGGRRPVRRRAGAGPTALRPVDAPRRSATTCSRSPTDWSTG